MRRHFLALLLITLFVTVFTGQAGYGRGVSTNVPVDDAYSGGQHLPSIALGPNDEVYIVWVDCRNDLTCQTNTQIYFAQSTDGGQSFGASVPVSDHAPTFANAPKIARDLSGNIYVVWHDSHLGQNSWDVYLSKLPVGGQRFDASVRVNASGIEPIPDEWHYEPDLAVDKNGNIYVSWTRKYFDPIQQQDDYDIYLTKSTNGGESFGSAVRVNTCPENPDEVCPDWQYKSSIKAGPVTGNVYVTWTDRRQGGISDVYFAKSRDGGATFSSNLRVNSYPDQSQGYPEMAIDDDEVIYIVWNDSRRLYTKGSRDIYMARSTDRGVSFEPEIKINDAKISPEFEYLYPVITAFGHGHVSIAWEDKRSGNWDVHLARSDDGGVSFRPSWRVNDARKGSQSVPDIIMDRHGEVHCTWRDQRRGNFDIYYASPTRSAVGLISPIGGEVIPSDSPYPIEWDAPAEATQFELFYSTDNGATWTKIDTGDRFVTGKKFTWTAPIPGNNRRRSYVKVVGYDSENKKVGADKSASPFTIEVVKVDYPNGAEHFASGWSNPYIRWTTNQTKRPVRSVELYYTKDGGGTWILIEEVTENPGRYPYWVPLADRIRRECMVKVVLKDENGIVVGSDTSDTFFTIEP